MKLRLVISLLFVTLLAASLGGCAEDAEPTSVSRVLPNGLTVVAQENRASELVAVHFWIRDGSIYEEPAQAGLANLLSRTLLSESEEFESGAMVRLIESLGGGVGAYGSTDYTRYIAVVPARHFDVTLDAISYCLLHPVLREETIESRKALILSEMEARSDKPLDHASNLANELLYGLSTRAIPYGTPETLAGLTVEQVNAYYRERYVPSNMVISVAGGVSPAHAVESVENIFGGLDPGEPARPVLEAVDWPESPRRRTVHREIKTGYMVIAFPGPGVDDPEVVTMDVVLGLLSRGRTSLLNKVLKEELGLVQAANAGWLTTDVPSPLTIWLELPPDKLDAAEQAVVDLVTDLAAEPPSEEELAIAIKQMQAYVYFGKETSSGMASHMAYWATVATPEFDEAYMQMLSEVTPEDVRSTVERYLRPESRVVAAVVPMWARSGSAGTSSSERGGR